MASRPVNKQQFKSYLLRKLGFPYNTIEVTEEQLDDCINDALRFYGEQVYDGTQTKFFLLDTSSGEREYDLFEMYPDTIIFAVEEVIDTSGFGSLYPTVFGLTQADIDFLFSLGRLEGNNLVDFELQLQRISAIKKVISEDPTWNFNFNTGKLIFGEVPIASKYGVVVSVIVDYDGKSTGNLWGNKFFSEYALALTKIQWGMNIGGKFEGFNIPGGGNQRGVDIMNEGREDKQRLEEYIQENEFDPEIFNVYIG